MPTRALLVCFEALFLALIIKILCFGHDFKKGPVPPGFRKWIIGWMIWGMSSLCLLCCGLHTSCNEIDVDYSEYLGPNYKDN